jgi:hypothetical protein
MTDSGWDVPTVAQMYRKVSGDPDPLDDSMLFSGCPRCYATHAVADLRATLGPLKREYSCPTAAGDPLVTVTRDGDGWTFRSDPGFLLDVRRA